VSSLAPSRWDRMLPAACCLWLALAVAAGIKAYVEPLEHTAYPCFEAGTRCWWQGADLYEATVCGHEYRYAPAIAVAMTPLAVLPTWLGGALWYWLNIAAFCWSLWALMRWVLPGDWTAGRKAAFLALVFLGSVRMIWAAQSNAMIFALVAGAAVAMRRGRWWWAAFFLAIPVHIKVWPLAVVLLLMACWPRQLLARFAVALAVVGAIPFCTKPFAWVCQEYTAWFAMLLGPAQLRQGHEYRDAWTVWELIHTPVDPRAYMVLQLAAAAVVLLLCWRRKCSRHTPCAAAGERHAERACYEDVLTFILAMWAAWQLVFGPGTERNTFGLIAPLTAWGLMTAWSERRGRVLMTAAFALTTLANFGVVERALGSVFPAVIAMHPVGVLLFVVWLNLPCATVLSCATAVSAVPAADQTIIPHGRDGRGTPAVD
jgi:alpha-1,2-mannosyltransferase